MYERPGLSYELRRIVTYRPLVLIGLFAATSVCAQQPKNVKILVGLSRPEVQRVMNQMRAGLGVHCRYCHVAGQDPSVDATPQKERARDMMRMVIDLNQRHFGGRDVVTCFTCHNGSPHPKTSPPLPQPLPRDLPANPPVADAKKPPSPSEVLQRYIAAVGRIVPATEPRTIIATWATPLGGPVATNTLESGEQMRRDITLPDGTPLTLAVTGAGGWIRDKSGVHDMQPEQWTSARIGRRPLVPFAESSFGDDATVTAPKIGDQDVWVVTTRMHSTRSMLNRDSCSAASSFTAVRSGESRSRPSSTTIATSAASRCRSRHASPSSIRGSEEPSRPRRSSSANRFPRRSLRDLRLL